MFLFFNIFCAIYYRQPAGKSMQCCVRVRLNFAFTSLVEIASVLRHF